MTMYEYRTDNSPAALPRGDSTISRHRTLAAARRAWDREHRRFAASPYSTGGAYLARVIVAVDADGDEHLVSGDE